jgi:uncharacterized protein YqfA (UPF0365 family)
MDLVLIAIFAVAAVLIALLLIVYFLPLGLWFTALFSGINVSILELMAMRKRKTPPELIIRVMITAHKAKVRVYRDQLEGHYRAGGNVENVVAGLIAAQKAGVKLDFIKATAADFQGIDLVEMVKDESTKQNTGD